MKMHRSRFKNTSSLQERLRAWADEFRAKADGIVDDDERLALIGKAEQYEAAMRLDRMLHPDWQLSKLP